MLTTAASATAAAATTATTAVARATAVPTAATHVSQLRGDLLLGFTQDSKQVSSLLVIVSREERDSGSLGATRELATDAMPRCRVELTLHDRYGRCDERNPQSY